MQPEFFVTPGYGDRLREQFYYSQAVKVGNRIETAGQGGWNDNWEFPESLEDEIRQAFDNLTRTLKTAGSGRRFWMGTRHPRQFLPCRSCLHCLRRQCHHVSAIPYTHATARADLDLSGRDRTGRSQDAGGSSGHCDHCRLRPVKRLMPHPRPALQSWLESAHAAPMFHPFRLQTPSARKRYR